MSGTASCFAPVSARTGEPLRLAMQKLWLTGQILPAGARLVAQHIFQSEEEQPLEVIYSFPLPRDAALRRFRITGEGFETESELRETDDAVKAYEQGITDGSLSALARQYGDGLVNLTVGNIRPKEKVTVYLELLAGVELRDDGYRFRFPFTLAPGYHSRMRASAEAGEGEMELPADEFGDLILPPFREDATGLHEVGFDLTVAEQLPIAEIGSPSHSIRVRQGAHVSLAPEKDLPNRDLVLDVAFQEQRPQVLAGADGAGKQSFAIVIPSTTFGKPAPEPRRIAILLDRSGSMQGEPIAQARKAIEACLAALEESDSFGLLAFDDTVDAMAPNLRPASREHRKGARAFLNQTTARGGTKLAEGVEEAAKALGGSGDILVITDGQVSGTEKILTRARAAGIRLFCLGIGSASQDRFLALLARETGGVSRFVTARERVDLTAVDLFASMGRPVASGLKASGVEPEPATAAFAGAPVLLFGEAESGARIEVTWDGGSSSFEIPAGEAAIGETLRLLRGSRLISDWESRYPSEEALAPLEKRRQSRVARRLAELSRIYGLANREMSLVAVVKRTGDRPGELPETRVVPVGMPQDTAFSAYFHRPRQLRRALILAAQARPLPTTPISEDIAMAAFSLQAPTETGWASIDLALGDSLLDLARMLEPDGGMPGDTVERRAARSAAAVLAFAADGHTSSSGAFRAHVTRLTAFLRSLQELGEEERALAERALGSRQAHGLSSAVWLRLAMDPKTDWKQVEAAMRRGRLPA